MLISALYNFYKIFLYSNTLSGQWLVENLSYILIQELLRSFLYVAQF